MIYCANNNTIYSTAAEAGRALGVNQATISQALAGQRQRAGVYVLANLENIRLEDLPELRARLLYSVYKISLDKEVLFCGCEVVK